MKTLDEAIIYHEQKYLELKSIAAELVITGQDITNLLNEAENHEQLTKWLKDLKAYSTLDKTNYFDGYNKAIDDLILMAEESEYGNIDGKEYIIEHLHTFANQLKAINKN